MLGGRVKVTPVTTTAPSSRRSRALVPATAALVAAVAALVILALRGGGDETEVSVYPGPTTLAASTGTGIVVRGAGSGDLDGIEVTGSRSGGHAGAWREHPDGNGATFVPDEPFAHGERVTVDAGMPIAGLDGKSSSFVVTRRNTAPSPPDDQAKEPAAQGVQTFASQPGLHPPGVRVDTASERAHRSKVFVGPKRGATQQGPMIVDASGELVWFRPLRGNEQAFDFRAQRYRGKPVLTWWQGRMQLYRGGGVGRIVGTRYRPVATVRAGNGYVMDAHEMKLTPAGTALVMSYFVVPWDLTKLGGRRDGLVEDNVVQEIDVDTGAVLFEWHTLGAIPLGESYRPAPQKRGQIHDPWHLNSVELDRDGDFIVSARHGNALYKIDRETGNVAWRLGGKNSSFEMGPGTVFRLQHDARVHRDGTLTLFDNVSEKLPARGKRSRGIAIELDQERMTASLAREFEHPDGILSPTQGSMQALRGGGAFVGWGGLQPLFTEFDRGGRVVFDARFRAKGVETYRAYRMPWRARGEGRPRAVASFDGEGTTVRVSWNGATEVARWRVRPAGGGSATTAARDGFETAIRVPGRPGSVVVEALGARGRVLGRSAAVPVR
jgi:Arylsulfotransferase (ASST)